MEDGAKVYEQFCGRHFPKMLEEPYDMEGYFDDTGSQAFVGNHEYGVLIRSDLDWTLGEILQMFLHEISHLFCTRNEITGGNFYDKYCMGSGPEDGMMNAGYAIWREAVADIMADSIISQEATVTLPIVRKELEKLYEQLVIHSPASKKAASLIIVYVMISREVAYTYDWSEAERAISKIHCLDDSLMHSMLRQVFDKLHESPYWEITPEFIMTLGETYISLISHKALRDGILGSNG